MKASELIEELQKLIEQHGDLEVFSTADYDWIGLPYYDDCSWMETDSPNKKPQFRMDSEFRG